MDVEEIIMRVLFHLHCTIITDIYLKFGVFDGLYPFLKRKVSGIT